MLVAGIGVMALVLAIIFGGTARRQIREAKGRERGKGMALAGSILGYVLLIPTAFFVVLVIAVSTI